MYKWFMIIIIISSREIQKMERKLQNGDCYY